MGGLNNQAQAVSAHVSQFGNLARDAGALAFSAFAALSFGAAIDGVTQLNDAVARYTALVGASAEEQQAATQSAIDLYKTGTEGYDQILTALANLQTAFGLTEADAAAAYDKFELFGKATGQTVSSSVDGLSRALKAWGLGAADAGSLMDKLVRSHQEYNLSVQQSEQLLTTLAPRFQGLNASLDDAIGLLDLFAQRGLNAAVASRGLAQAIPKLQQEGLTLDQFIQQLASLSSQSDRTKLAIQVFGRIAGPALAESIQPGMNSLADVVSGMSDVNGASDQAGQAIENSFSEKAIELVHQFAGSVTQVAQAFGPAIGGAVQAEAILGPRIWAFASSGAKLLKTDVIALAAALGAVTPVAEEVVKDLTGLKLANEAVRVSADEAAVAEDGLKASVAGAGTVEAANAVEGGLMAAAMEALSGAIVMVGGAITAVAGFLVAFAVPIVAIIAVVGLLAIAWANDWLDIREIVGGAGDFIRNVLGAIGQAIGAVSDAMGTFVATAQSQLQGLLGPLARVNDLLGQLPGPWKDIAIAQHEAAISAGFHAASSTADAMAIQAVTAAQRKGNTAMQETGAGLDNIARHAEAMASAVHKAALAVAMGPAYFHQFTTAAEETGAGLDNISKAAIAAANGVKEGAKSVETNWKSALGAVLAAAKATYPPLYEAGNTMAGKIADGMRAGRDNIIKAWLQLQTDEKSALTRQQEIARLGGILTSAKLQEGLASQDPLVRAAAENVVALVTGELNKLGVYALAAGATAGANLLGALSKSVDAGTGMLERITSGALGPVGEQAVQQLTAGFDSAAAAAKAYADAAKAAAGNLSDAWSKLTPKITSAHTATKTAASSMKSDIASAFGAMKTAADAYFDALHQHNMQAITDTQTAADALAKQKYDAQAAQLQAPVTDAQKKLKAALDDQQRQRLVESLADAQNQLQALLTANASGDASQYQDPTQAMRAVRDAQNALTGFLAQQQIDQAQQGVDAAIKGTLNTQTGQMTGGLDQGLAATIANNKKIADAKAAAENARYADQKGGFDKAIGELEKQLEKEKKLHSSTITQIQNLYTKFGLSVIGFGATIGDNLAKGMTSKIKDVDAAAQALAAVIAKYLKVKSPAQAGPLADDIRLWGSNIITDIQSGLLAKLPELQSAVDQVGGTLSPLGERAPGTLDELRKRTQPINAPSSPINTPGGLPGPASTTMSITIDNRIFLDGTEMKDWVVNTTSQALAQEQRNVAGPIGSY